MALNAVGAVNYSGISVEGDSIFDNIFDWITNSINSIINATGDQFVKVINAIGQNFTLVVTAVASAVGDIIITVGNVGNQVLSGVFVGINSIITNLGSVANQIVASVFVGLNSIITNLGSVANQILAGVFVGINSIITNLGSVANQILAGVFVGINSIITNIGSVANQIMGGISQMASSVAQTIVGTFSAISLQVQSNFTWITGWLSTSIPQILGSWWDLFVGKIFNFVDWVPKLLDTISAWMSRDIPGHSPWWHTLIQNVVGFIFDQAFQFITPTVKFAMTYVLPEVLTVIQPLGELFNTVLDGLINAVEEFISPLGPMEPIQGLANFHSLSKVGTVALAALAGMTAAGNWLKPLGDAGMGNIAAMIYDLTNYKLVTGAFMGALVTAVLAKPLRYYYAWKFRPDLPSIRELSDMFTDEGLTSAEYGQYLAYHGIPDYWHEKYESIAYRAMSPYQLKSAAQDGSFDEGIFSRELTHAGFRPETKKMLLDSFRKAAAANVQTYSVAGATGRFKAGWTNEDQFTTELQLLRVNTDMIPVYLAMTKLDFATGYLNDIETAYVNAVRSGQIGIDDYRLALLNLGMVPQRVEAKVFIEQARIKPSGSLSPVASAKAYYLTAAGAIVLDTTRRQRRKAVITREQELAAFSDIGMPVDLAAAYADNDDVRLKESAATSGG